MTPGSSRSVCTKRRIFRTREISHRISGQIRAGTVTSSPKSPNKSPPFNRDASLTRKFFASRRNLYLPSAHAVYSDYLFFPRWLHSIDTGNEGVVCPSLSSLPPPPIISTRGERPVSSNRYVFRVAWLVHGIASWSAISRKNIRRTLIITRSTKFLPPVDLTPNFED